MEKKNMYVEGGRVSNLKVLQVVGREIPKYDLLDNDIVSNILGDVDDSRITSTKKYDLLRFINDCNDDREEYMVLVEYDIIPNYMNIIAKYTIASDSYIRRDILKVYLNWWENIDNDSMKKDVYDVLTSHNVKGIRDNQSLSVLLKKAILLDETISDYNKQDLLDKLSINHRKEWIYISNNALSQLTSSYNCNWSSCYDLVDGEYRASNIYLMNDCNNHIIKSFKYDDNDSIRYDDESIFNLPYTRRASSRCNIYTDNENYIIRAKVYGDSTGIINNTNDVVKLMCSVIDIDYDYITSKTRYNNSISFEYVNSFHGYKDYNYNLIYAYGDLDDLDNVVIGEDCYIMWDIDCSSMIIMDNGVYSEYYDRYIDEDDAIYVDSDNDYYYYDDVYYDRNREEYYAFHNTDYLYMNGYYYNIEYLDITYNA